MTSEPVAIGRPVRPEGSLAFGTIGCLARKDGVVHIVTCDHVLNLLGTPEGGPVPLHGEMGPAGNGPLAIFRGLSLVSISRSVADLAAAPIVNPPPPDLGLLPEPLPGTGRERLAGVTPPAEGMKVWTWGARSRGYHEGRIAAALSGEILPHPKYGPRRFELQMAVQVDPEFIPEVGDSGGPILAASGHLVGFLAGGPQFCRIEAPDRCVAYGVPGASALERLGLEAIVKEENHDQT